MAKILVLIRLNGGKFEAIAEYLGNYLARYNRIEHVGSTSIPGMDAKPIIDIDIEIETEADFDKLKAELERIGYIHCGDQGIQGRETFKRILIKAECIRFIHSAFICLEKFLLTK